MKIRQGITSLSIPLLLAACGMDAQLPSAEETEATLDSAALVSALTEDGDDPVSDISVDGAEEEVAHPRMHRRAHKLHRVCSVLAHRERVIERFDADGDGALSDEERTALKEAFEGRKERRGGKGGKAGKGRPAHRRGDMGPPEEGDSTEPAAEGEAEGFLKDWQGRYAEAYPEESERASFFITRPGPRADRM